MALRLRRGLESQRTSIVPETGELLYVTDHIATGASPLWVGDGTTAGGNSVSGIAPGIANSLARYTGTSANVVPTENITWNETTNTFQVSSGSISITAGNGPRNLLNLNTFSNTVRGNSLTLSRARGNESAPSPLLSVDAIGTINFSAYDGVSTNAKVSITGFVGTTVVAGGSTLAASYGGKTGTGPFYVTFNIPTQGSAPATGKQYVISGNGNTLYNGSYPSTASTTSSITLAYGADPGTFGSGLTEIKAAPITSSALIATTNTSNGNSIKAFKLYQDGHLTIGPNYDDLWANTGTVVDPIWNGQLSVISTVTSSSNIARISSVTLKSYFDGVTGQYLAMQRYRGTVTTPAAVQQNDQIYNLNFSGYDGIGTVRSSNIRALVDGPVSTNVVPGAILFTTANASGVQTLALKLTSSQEIQVGGTISSAVPPATYWNYDVSGSNITMTLGQTLNFANFSGSILVNCYNSGTVTQYLCGGGGTPLEAGSSKVSPTGTMVNTPGINGYTFTATEAGVHSFYVIRTRTGA